MKRVVALTYALLLGLLVSSCVGKESVEGTTADVVELEVVAEHPRLGGIAVAVYNAARQYEAHGGFYDPDATKVTFTNVPPGDVEIYLGFICAGRSLPRYRAYQLAVASNTSVSVSVPTNLVSVRVEFQDIRDAKLASTRELVAGVEQFDVVRDETCGYEMGIPLRKQGQYYRGQILGLPLEGGLFWLTLPRDLRASDGDSGKAIQYRKVISVDADVFRRGGLTVVLTGGDRFYTASPGTHSAEPDVPDTVEGER